MLLLDTCTLLWLASDQEQLSKPVKQAVAGGAGRLFVSAISAFEIGVKHNRGKLTLPSPPAVTALPMLHNDPMDRILVATSQLRRLTLLTPDPLIQAYPEISHLW